MAHAAVRERFMAIDWSVVMHKIEVRATKSIWNGRSRNLTWRRSNDVVW